jgi:hypothetical protein
VAQGSRDPSALPQPASQEVEESSHLTLGMSIADSLGDLDSGHDHRPRLIDFAESVQDLTSLEPGRDVIRVIDADSCEAFGGFFFITLARALHRQRVVQEEICRIPFKHLLKLFATGHPGNLFRLKRSAIVELWL